MNRYADFTAEKFAQDDFFRRWVQQPDAETNAFWSDFMAHYPHKQPAVRAARALLNAVATIQVKSGLGAGRWRYKYYRNFMPEKPYYQDLVYRKSIPMMQEILQLRDEGKLNATQMMWFRKTKPTEELCDTQTDPDEFTNLVDNPAYKSKLAEWRGQLDAWLKKVGDKAAIPEADMVKQMWNGGSEPPQTANPKLVRSGNTVSIRCATRGASVGYILEHGPNQSNVWQVYGGENLTLQSGDSLRVIAQRIGYQPSSEVKLKQ